MRLLAAAASALTIAIAASGCGASDTVDPAVVAKAADRTAAAGTARLALVAQFKGQTLRGQGAIDPKTGRSQITLALPQGQGEIESRYIGGMVYLHLPEKARDGLPGGRSWAKIDIVRMMRSKGIDVSKVRSPSGDDPTQTVAQLRGAGDVERVGKDTVRGAPTTHYKTTVDLRKAAERAATGSRDTARKGMNDLIKASGGRTTAPVEVWIDDKGRVRRMRTVQRINDQDVTETMELYDFGGDQAIVAPSGDDTADVTDETIRQLG
jgi:hypothetical protein